MLSGLFARTHARCACAGTSFGSAAVERKYERSRPFVVTHLALDLDVLFEARAVEGEARIDFERRAPNGRELALDAVGFVLHSVSLRMGDDERLLSDKGGYAYDGETLTVTIPEELLRGTLSVRYRAEPRVGLYFLAPDAEVKDRPRQVWSQCQDEDGRHWFPCLDKPHVKMTTEVRVRVPAGMTALSNGALIASDTPKQGENWMFHYRLDVPHPSYLVTLVVGEFDEWLETATLPSGREVPLRYLVPVGRKSDGKRAFAGTAEMLRLFSERIGVEYPWESYAQVVVSDFIFGGMENTTATTMYEHILLDKTAALDIESHDLVAHELAHQWFGDLVTCRDWSHAWLNEGFATFMELIEREARLGRDEYDQGVMVDLDAYLGEANAEYKRPIVSGDYEEPIDLFDRHLYQKGGLVLHMLRRMLGDVCFWSGVRSYLEHHRNGIVETRDLMRALETSSGISLERFFDHWVMRPGHPELDVKVAFADDQLTIDVEQKQTGHDVAVFELPFEVAVCEDGVWTTHGRTIDQRKASLVIRTNGRPQGIVIDPELRVTAPLTLTAPADLLQKTVELGPSARGRAQAAEALAKRNDPKTIAALAASLHNEDESWIVRAQSAASLAKIRGVTAELALREGSRALHPKVRRAVAAALGQFSADESIETLVELAKRDASYMVNATAARSLGKTRKKAAVERLRGLLKRDSWADVIRAGALDGMAASGDEDFVSDLLEWSQYGRPTRARRAAIAALGSLGEGRKVREHLGRLLVDKDPHLRTSVLAALERLNDPKARSFVHDALEHELDGRVLRRAKKTLAALGSDKSKALQKQREETQRLEKELTELKVRLSKLEQSLERKAESGAAKTAADSAAAPKAAPPKAAAPKAAPPKAAAPKAAAKTTPRPSQPAKKASKKVANRVAKKASKKPGARR
ncbi:MAG TPA: M1 family aminopeptidase [Polyangiaceae bacterium]|nr:M1 family aminopeptidase [Polyangiaceae bacterium]